MQQARDEAGNIWEVDAQGNAVRLIQAAPARTQSGVVAPSPTRLADEARKREDQEFERQRLAMEQERLRLAQGQAALQSKGETRQDDSKFFTNTSGLRSDFNAEPAVKSYTKALPRYIKGLQSSPDAAGDLSLIYAYAGIQDPDSVVREGEAASVASGDTLFGRTVARLEKERGEGGTFRPEYREQLRREMRSAVGALNRAYIDQRVRYKQTADRFGVNPLDVVGEHIGKSFQDAEARFLKRDIKELDYNGNVIGGTSGEPSGGSFRPITPTSLAEYGAGVGKPQVQPDGSVNVLQADGTTSTYSDQELYQRAMAEQRLAAQYGRNSEQFRAAYRQQFGEDPPLDAGVVTDDRPNSPSDLEQRRDTAWGAADATVRGAADMATLGIADPLSALMRSAFNDKGFSANWADERRINAADEQVNPWWRMGGQFAGGLPTAYRLGALGGAAIPSRPLLGTALGETAAGSFYGGISNPDDPLLGAVKGGAISLAGNQIGQRVVGPLVDRAVARFNGQADPVVRQLALTSDRTDFNRVAGLLEDANRLSVPMALADTDPSFRSLAGSATRIAPAGREYAEQVIGPRGRGQAERAIAAVERDFAPAVNMGETGDALIAQGRSASSPLYAQAYGTPVPSTPELDTILNTPAGRAALARARTIAANERRDPAELGFAMDADGNVVLNPQPTAGMAQHLFARQELDQAQEAYRAIRAGGPGDAGEALARVEAARNGLRQAEAALAAAPDPSAPASVRAYTTQTLDYVKRGMDDILEGYRDPVTRRLQLDEAGRAINGVRAGLIREVDRLNPTYAEARAAYEAPARQRDALNAGYGAVSPRTSPDTMGRMTAGLGPDEMGQFRSGYSTGMVEQIERMRRSVNPYESINGSPGQTEKLTTLFPDGIDNFSRQTELEQQLARTQYETLGGSPTASRQQADAQFGPDIMGDIVIDALTGRPPLGIAGRIARTAADRYRMGIQGPERGRQIAELLLTPQPTQALTAIERILLRQQLRDQSVGASAVLGSALALPMAGAE
jgi:hypothetical protein